MRTAANYAARLPQRVNIYRNQAFAKGPFIGALQTSKVASCALPAKIWQHRVSTNRACCTNFNRHRDNTMCSANTGWC